MAEPDGNGRLGLREISAYGVYTAGAIAKAPDADEWIYLEYDVTNLPGLPERIQGALTCCRSRAPYRGPARRQSSGTADEPERFISGR